MNIKSSVGLTEELITNLINLVALEYHLRITVEKYYSLLNVKKVEDEDKVLYLSKKLQSSKNLLEVTTTQRRNVMSALQELGTDEANPDMWCSVKHTAVQMITMFEAWQVDFDNVVIENLYHSSVELFNLVISEFLGYTPQPCSACLADSMTSQEEINEIKSKVSDKISNELNADEVFARGIEVFGNGIESVLEEK